jgi:hypothetical protein
MWNRCGNNATVKTGLLLVKQVTLRVNCVEETFQRGLSRWEQVQSELIHIFIYLRHKEDEQFEWKYMMVSHRSPKLWQLRIILYITGRTYRPISPLYVLSSPLACKASVHITFLKSDVWLEYSSCTHRFPVKIQRANHSLDARVLTRTVAISQCTLFKRRAH